MAFLTFAGIAWGTTGAAVDIVYRSSDLGPMAISFWRFFGGMLLLLLGRLVRPARLASRPRQAPARRALLFVGTGLGLAIFQTAYFAAVQNTGLAIGTIVTLGASPMFTAAGGRVFLSERIGRAGVLSIAGAVGGLAILVLGDAHAVIHPLGVAFAMLSAMGYAVSNLLGRWTGRHGNGEDPYTLTMWSFGIGAFVMLPLACAEGILPQTDHPARVVLLLLYVAIVTTAVAYPLYFAGAGVVRAATASVVMLIEPISAAFLAVMFLGESLAPTTLLGTLLMLVAIAILAITERG